MILRRPELERLTAEERRLYLELQEERARRAARDSLRPYAELVFGVTPAAHHEVMIDALEAIERGAIRRLVIIAPPGHAKSTYGSIIFPSWYLGRHPTANLIGVTLTETLGDTYGDAIANVLEHSEEWRGIFRGVEPDKRRGWSRFGRYLRQLGVKRDPLSKDPQIVYMGAGSGIVGRRADGVIVDDVVDREIARSETQLAQRVSWIQGNVITRLQPGAWAVVIGTLWGEGDVVTTLRGTGDWVVIKLQAESSSQAVYAEVAVPADVEWRPVGWEEAT